MGGLLGVAPPASAGRVPHLCARIAARAGEPHQVGGVAGGFGEAADEVVPLLGLHLLLHLPSTKKS